MLLPNNLARASINNRAPNGTQVSLHDHPYHCPHCGSDTVRHDAIEIVACGRATPTCTHVVVRGADVSIGCGYDVYPTASDSHIRIGFWCEVCGKTHELTFLHHEGQTFTATHIVGMCHGA
jgi:ribosomal protein L37AE/L43A